MAAPGSTSSPVIMVTSSSPVTATPPSLSPPRNLVAGSLRGLPQIGEEHGDDHHHSAKALPRQSSGRMKMPSFLVGSSRRSPLQAAVQQHQQEEDLQQNIQAINGHAFVLFNYATPASCKHCHKAIWRYDKEHVKCKQTQLQEAHRWSLQKFGYRCRACSLDVHTSCAPFFEHPCEQGHFMNNVRKSLIRRSRTRSIDDYAQIVRPSAGYNLEDGLSGILQGAQELAPPAAMEQTAWYTLHFTRHEHNHFIMSDKKHTFDPFIISIMRETEDGAEEGEGEEEEGEEAGEDQGEDDVEQQKSPPMGMRPRTESDVVDSDVEDLSLNDKERKKLEKKKEKERKEKEKKELREKREREKQERKLQKKLQKAKEEEDSLYRVIVWKKGGKEQWTIPVKHNERLSGSDIAEIVLPDKKGTLRMMEKNSPLYAGLAKELTMMEKEEYTNQIKIGVLYTCKGQSHEDEYFGNEKGSPQFYEFMDALGEKVALKGYEGFRGGLDIEGGNSGEFAYVTEFQGNEIIFHVSTLLPYSATDPQQIKRKRHIGNDVCCIVFQDNPGCCFSPRAVQSQFIHTFAAVCLEPSAPGLKRYRLNVTTRDTVPAFGPALPDPPVFSDPKELREFLLQKIVNAERSALYSESFQQRRERTLGAHLSYIHSRYSGESTAKKTVVRQKLGESKRAPKGLTLDLSLANPLNALTAPFSGSRSARYSDTSKFRSFQQEPPPSPTTSTSPPPKTRPSIGYESVKGKNLTSSPEIGEGHRPSIGSSAVPPKMKRRGSAPALFVSNPQLLDSDTVYGKSDAAWEKVTPEMVGIKSTREV